MSDEIKTLLPRLLAEINLATQEYGEDFASLHEAHSVLKEEYDELWDEIKVKERLRDLEQIQAEAIQVAATALRIAAHARKGKRH